jgi:hypothetical protein
VTLNSRATRPPSVVLCGDGLLCDVLLNRSTKQICTVARRTLCQLGAGITSGSVRWPGMRHEPRRAGVSRC